jgi:signal transduction histidine kinase/Tfp pilus assembly protein PilF
MIDYKHIKNISLYILLSTIFQLSVFADNSKQDILKRIDSLEVYLAENPASVLNSARTIQKQSVSQNNISGQVLALCLVANTYVIMGQIEKAQLAIDSAFVVPNNDQLPAILLKLYKSKAAVLHSAGNTTEALKQVEKGKQSLKLVNDPSTITLFYQWVGDFYSQMGNSEQAIKEKLYALKVATPTEQPKLIALAYHSLGNTYWFHGQYDNAKEAYKNALSLRESLHDTLDIVQTLRNIGLVNRDIGKTNESREVLVNALALSKKINGKSQVADILNLLGSIAVKNGNPMEAIGYYQESYSIRMQLGLLQSAAVTQDNLARVKKEMGLFGEAENHLNKSLELRTQIGDKKGIASSYNELGNLFSLKGDLTEALRYYLLSLKARQELGSSAEIARSLTNIGLTYRKLNSHSNALKYFEKALELSTETSDPIGMSYIYIHIGNTQKELKRYRESIENYKKALTLREQSANEALRAPVLRNIAIALSEQGKTDEAKKYLNHALVILTKLSDEKGIADIKNELGNIALYENKLTEAINFFTEASITFGNHNELDKKGLCLRKIGEAHTKLGSYGAALPFLNEALALAKLTKNGKLAELTLLALYNYYNSKEMHKEALAFYTKHITVRDSLNATNQKESILQLSVELELGKKLYEIRQIEAEIELLKTEDALKTAIIQRQNSVRNLMIVIISLLAILVIVITYGYLLFKRANKKLAESSRELKINIQTKDKLFSIIAHDLRSPFTALAGLTEILATQVKSLEPSVIEEFSKNINESSLKLLALIDNLLHWARSQTGRLVLKPQAVSIVDIINQAAAVQEIQAKQKEIEVVIISEQNIMLNVDIDTMNTVFRNLISNAIKFTKPNGKITIKAYKTEGLAIVSIADNGVGIKEENLKNIFNPSEVVSTKGTSNESGSGLGLTLCKDFVEKNGGSISVASQIGIGTTFTIELPLIK